MHCIPNKVSIIQCASVAGVRYTRSASIVPCLHSTVLVVVDDDLYWFHGQLHPWIVQCATLPSNGVTGLRDHPDIMTFFKKVQDPDIKNRPPTPLPSTEKNLFVWTVDVASSMCRGLAFYSFPLHRVL
jgi:hypothetical protein